MKQPIERRLAAILAMDVVGYSRLMGTDEEGTLERLKSHRRELIDPKITEHRGRIVKTMGDGLLAEFPSVVDAVRCAVKIQRAMIDRNAEVASPSHITFRAGINLGDVIIDGDDIYGDGVNIAARLEALAEPGGICISRVVRDQIRDKLAYPFEDMGEQSVKNIARPVRSFAMGASVVASIPYEEMPPQSDPAQRRFILRRAIVGACLFAVIGLGFTGWWIWPKESLPKIAVESTTSASPRANSVLSSTSAPRLSFVVLPFENLSRDQDEEYFADGITDDLTTDLSRIAGSFVIARNTAFTYKGKPTDVKQIGRELGVRYVIEGSVRRTSNQVQVNVQLIDAETGAHVWADRFDTSLASLGEAQIEITGRLARTLNVELMAAGAGQLDREKIVSPDSRDFVMRGWAWFYRPASVETYEKAQRAFERALEIDPISVEAKLGLAQTLLTAIGNGFALSTIQKAQARVEQLLSEVLSQDANKSLAHSIKGGLRGLQDRRNEGQVEYETAIVFDKNNWFALRGLANVHLFLGRPEAGIPYIEKAIQLSPRDPTIAENYSTLGACYLLLGDADRAIDLFRKARAANPRLFYVHLWLAGALGFRGDISEAKAGLEEAIKIRPEVNSVARWREYSPWITNPQHWALREKTLNAGLRLAGFPDE
jgi:TolB-like protein/class 3 adenylate cyclase/tetratricopeptide (TPR) repeat protein